MRLLREVEDRPGVALSVGALGCLTYLQGSYELAKPLLEERLQIWQETGNRHGIAWSLYTLGDVALQQNAWRQAIELFADSLAMFQELLEIRGVARCIVGLAEVAQEIGQLNRAVRLLAAAQMLLETRGIYWEDDGKDPIGGYPVTTQVDFERHRLSAQAALGEEAFTAAWAAGGAMTLEQAIAYALNQLT